MARPGCKYGGILYSMCQHYFIYIVEQCDTCKACDLQSRCNRGEVETPGWAVNDYCDHCLAFSPMAENFKTLNQVEKDIWKRIARASLEEDFQKKTGIFEPELTAMMVDDGIRKSDWLTESQWLSKIRGSNFNTYPLGVPTAQWFGPTMERLQSDREGSSKGTKTLLDRLRSGGEEQPSKRKTDKGMVTIDESAIPLKDENAKRKRKYLWPERGQLRIDTGLKVTPAQLAEDLRQRKEREAIEQREKGDKGDEGDKGDDGNKPLSD